VTPEPRFFLEQQLERARRNLALIQDSADNRSLEKQQDALDTVFEALYDTVERTEVLARRWGASKEEAKRLARGYKDEALSKPNEMLRYAWLARQSNVHNAVLTVRYFRPVAMGFGWGAGGVSVFQTTEVGGRNYLMRQNVSRNAPASLHPHKLVLQSFTDEHGNTHAPPTDKTTGKPAEPHEVGSAVVAFLEYVVEDFSGRYNPTPP